MMDEKSKPPPEIDDKSKRALTAISNILNKIADKSNITTNNLLKLEKENRIIEETEFIECKPETPTKQPDNTISNNDNQYQYEDKAQQINNLDDGYIDEKREDKVVEFVRIATK